ncbi:MAG: acetyl-CoA carboxylase biotin carboxyl carrier protein subunit [Chloroflexi bacterium]|nr:acetyl-CoA carboxylase biotin carboxyl carrier protein subunit [Chloroflexota bacterium]
MALERVETPLPGRVLSVDARVGQRVKEGDVICTLESMKMETPIAATLDGVIKEIAISAGQEIQSDTLVAIIEY